MVSRQQLGRAFWPCRHFIDDSHDLAIQAGVPIPMCSHRRVHCSLTAPFSRTGSTAHSRSDLAGAPLQLVFFAVEVASTHRAKHWDGPPGIDAVRGCRGTYPRMYGRAAMPACTGN